MIRRAAIPMLCLGILFAPQARAACGASVSASVSDTTLTITASASGACGLPMIAIAIDGIHWASASCTTPSCTRTFTSSIACWHSRSYAVTATTTCGKQDGEGACVVDSPGTATTSFFVPPATPTIGVSYLGPDALGHGSLQFDYGFPNTETPYQRAVEL